MGLYNLVLLFYVAWFSFSVGDSQLQSSQIQVLLQVRKHLEYPKQLEIWNNRWTDFCSLSSSSQVNVTCQYNLVTELRIVGDTPAKVRSFNGFAIPNQTLSKSFSMDSFIATLARLTSLRVLCLVSLNIWGPLPDKIHRLFGLEHLDLSSNYLFGSVPPKISTMVNLQILMLDNNFFNSTVPDWFGSLTNLRVLSLRNNRLRGPFPSSILSMTNLTDLVMSSNEISGRLPDFSSLSNLQMLDLSRNRLGSTLPAMPKWLLMVFLSNNSFAGEIPKRYGELNRLQQLDISFNALTGIPPAALFSLPNISFLNLASNKLSGSLPDRLSCNSKLRFVDISNNRLIGGLPSCLSMKSENRVVKLDGNCLTVDMQHQHVSPYCTEVHMKKKPLRVGVLVGIVVVMVLLAFVFLVIFRRFCPGGLSEQHLLHKAVQDSSAAGFTSELLTNARFISEASRISRQVLPMYRSFSIEELKEATDNFDNSAFMGESLYGKLYKGKLQDGTQVAIRCLPLPKKYSIRNLKLRLDLLAKLRHPYLVCLLGHCIDGVGQDDYSANIFLVSEYVPNGNFSAYLSGNSLGKVLNWSERLAVLISVAKAVHFLHTGMIPGFFNNRLKTNNILLDEHWVAKLSDFGLSIISEENDKNDIKGEGPKSWQAKKLEDDVYCFGFILLDALVGPSVTARREAFLLNEMASFISQDGWKRTVDPIVQATCSRESLSVVISITNKCVSPDSWNRPSIEDVLWNLQYAAQVQATADGDQRFDAAPHQ
ncbi:Tyrosine-protein kinase [Quillaja saponaria]|uniref:Tyrosine-protein kinase n=1 Tax=Quillaja saponaria TaxID=32244 RepID=A0AAD7LE41_QUISA|nr:Tyrosine-protein kinase [Quillaja saponaria]KAJ7956072.1 Tyrosine-protein kinase [Quillaja saponaria]